MNKQDTAKVSAAIHARMKALKIPSASELTTLLGYEQRQMVRVYNWIRGVNGPNASARNDLIDKLGVPAEVFDGITIVPHGSGRDRPAKKSKPGPAQRAVALAEQVRANGGQALALSPPAPVISDVFSCRVRSDSTMQVKLDAVLPFIQGMALMKFLLDFGLVQDQERS
jgi:hypothetical protein